jgi:hypothetical protein
MQTQLINTISKIAAVDSKKHETHNLCQQCELNAGLIQVTADSVQTTTVSTLI